MEGGQRLAGSFGCAALARLPGRAEALTTRINDVISRQIAARPELWLWMHDRWKGNASGEIESETSDGQ